MNAKIKNKSLIARTSDSILQTEFRMWTTCRNLFAQQSHIYVEELIWGNRSGTNSSRKRSKKEEWEPRSSPSAFRKNLSAKLKILTESSEGKFALFLIVSQVASTDNTQRMAHTNALVVRCQDSTKTCK